MVFRTVLSFNSVFCFVLFFVVNAQAQCPITVSAGDDKVVCTSGGTAVLDGVIGGNYIDFRWTPTTGLSDPTSLNPQVTINGSVTYTLTAAAFDPSAPNLISNPGFEAGISGYTTGYSYNPTPVTPGTYVLTTSPELVVNNFPPCDDHTFGNGTGNLMLVNGNGNANTQVWCQSVPVMPNSWYYLQAWALVSPISPPAFQFSVNGTLIGNPANLFANGCDWQDFTSTWFSGTSSSATVCIFDVSGTGNGLFGNDFALDDIFMSKACTVSDQVKVEVANVNAVLQPSILLPCTAATNGITLNGTGSSVGPNITYEWDGPGIISGSNTLTPVVNEPGAYTLTVSLQTGTEICTDEAIINVVPDPFSVVAEAVVYEELNCQVVSVGIDGSNSTSGPNITYTWAPLGGVVAGANTAQPEVNLPGTYTLTVTNSTGNCTATTSVSVSQNLAPATATATAVATLPCQGPGEIQLSGAGSSVGPAFIYLWSGPGIVSGANSLNNCVVNAAGTYTLLVTNDISGCTASDTATVVQNGVAPIAVISTLGQLSCSDSTMTLTSAGSSTGPTFEYLWSTNNGGILGSNNGPSILIDTTGIYQLKITNLNTGCTGTANAIITGLYQYPVIGIDTNLVINCFFDSLQLIGTTMTGTHEQYNWTSLDGNLLSGGNTLSPWINIAGTYQLLALDTLSGCSSLYSVVIPADTTRPSVQTAPMGSLTCSIAEIMISATGSLNSVPFWYFNSNSGGNGISSGENSFQPIVNAPGTYIITLIDTINGCSGIDSVVILQNINAPLVNAGPDTMLTCSVNQILLVASGQPSNIGYLWSNGTTGLQTTVNQPQQLIITALDSLNGCAATDTVLIGQSTAVPTVAIVSPGVLTCTQSSLFLLADSNILYGYQWSYIGQGVGVLSGANTPICSIGSPGIYTLVITDLGNTCTNQYAVIVDQSTDPPSADAGPPQVLSCGQTTLQLDGTLSSIGTPFIYEWSTQNGLIQSGSNSLVPTVTSAGNYQLMVTDTTNGCTAIAQVVVTEDANAPIALIQSTGNLNCSQSEITLSSNGSSTGIPFVFSWDGANIISDPTQAQVSIDQPGIYTLTITNQLNNCSAFASILIQQDTTSPVAIIDLPSVLNCQQTQLNLNAGSSTTGLLYSWNGPGILSGAQTLFPLIQLPGQYSLLVTNNANGCTATASVNVLQDTMAPPIGILENGILNCTQQTTTLTANNQSPNLLYTWSGPGIISDPNSNLIQVNNTGNYTLLITDSANGCTSSSSYLVMGDYQTPTAVASSPSDLNCTITELQISGVGSSSNMLYEWSGPGIISSTFTLNALVNTAGAYQLKVTNPVNGCTSVATLIVSQDTLTPNAQAAGGNDLTCLQTQTNLAIIGNTVGMELLWTGPGIVQGATTASPVVGLSGTYQLLVRNPINGCTANSATQVNENKTIPDVDAGADQFFSCDTDFLTLQGSSSIPDAVFSWTAISGTLINGIGTNSPTAAAVTGLYELKITDPGNGCTNLDTVLIREIQPIFPAASFTNPTCFENTGEIVFQGGHGDFLYSINGGGIFSTDSIYSGLLPGTYLAISQNSAGCEDSTTLLIQAVATLSIQLPAIATLNIGGSILLQPVLNQPITAVDTLYWTPSVGLSCSDCLTPVANPGVSTVYKLIVQSVDGCSDTTSISILYQQKGGIFIPTIFNPGGPWENATFYPHTDLIVLKYQLQLFDRWGSLIYQSNELIKGWDGKQRGKWSEQGVYTYKIEMDIQLENGTSEKRTFVGDVTLIR